MSPDFDRTPYAETPEAQRLPRDEANAILNSVEQALLTSSGITAQLFLLAGPPGIGKTFLLEQIQTGLDERDIRCFPPPGADSPAINAGAFLDADEQILQAVLQWCGESSGVSVPAPPAGADRTIWLSTWMDGQRRNVQSPPLALFVDDVERWSETLHSQELESGTDREEAAERIRRVYQLLWQPLLRHPHSPSFIFCAGRSSFLPRLPVSLLARLRVVRLGEFADDLVSRLIDSQLPDQTRTLILRYAQGNPRIAQWLSHRLLSNADVLHSPADRESLIEELFWIIVDKRVAQPLGEILLGLARRRPSGFKDTDSLLRPSETFPISGRHVLDRLIRAGFVEYVPEQSYQVLPPIVHLFSKERS